MSEARKPDVGADAFFALDLRVGRVIGVADAVLAPLVAEALLRLGRRHALVFRGEDGLDELTTTGPSRMWEVRDGRVSETLFDPASLGVARARPEDLLGGEVDANLRVADTVLSGVEGPAADVVALNAAAALYVADAVPDIGAGLALARATLAAGTAAQLRDRWVARTKELAAS